MGVAIIPPAAPLPAPWGPSAAPAWPAGGGAPGGGGFTPAFPILTEEVGFPPSPLAGGLAGGPKSPAAGGSPLGMKVTRALQDVLGWKLKAGDATGFLGALNQSFQVSLVEGHAASKWTPRSYVVQSDLSGGITGAQASVYTMANTLLGQMLPLVDGLYALDPAADQEYVTALKQLATSQLTNLGQEIGYLGGPRVMRVHQYFQMLLGGTVSLTMPPVGGPPSAASVALVPTPAVPPPPYTPPPYAPGPPAPGFYTDPDQVMGTLGDLRDLLGLRQNPGAGVVTSYINTIDDETNVTNFRIIVDYANSLWNAWQNSIQFFITTSTPFLGTQLVIISRQLGVISEIVDEVRFVLDSVFIGPQERQTALLNLALLGGQFTNLPPIFLEDLLSWTQAFVTEEAPAVIQSGGKFGLGEDFCAMIWQLSQQIYGAYQYAYQMGTPPGINTVRVLTSMQKLAGEMYELYTLAYPVGSSYLQPRP
ncbi:MAG TPA: hypothetical protein VMU81_26160 [Acetobacteraceae bacterium]|nr:hypothetical protein [Acetobacteraceae bacterium]